MAVKADITIDIDKQVGELQNLTQIYNARVGDNKTPLTIAWRKNDLPLNLKGLHAYIVGKTGDGSYNSETGKIDFPINTPVSQFEDDGSGTLDGGQSGLTTLLIPKQMWQNSGLFAGYIGLKSEDGSVFTSKDIWFKVLGNVLDAGVEINYFIGDFDKALAEAKGKLDDALTSMQKNYDTEVGNSRESLKLLSSEIESLRAKIKDDDFITTGQYDKDMDQMKQVVENKLSSITYAPTPITNSNDLQTSYPNGKPGIFITMDTGHKWIYFNNSWKDCGVYQGTELSEDSVNEVAQQLEDKTGNYWSIQTYNWNTAVNKADNQAYILGNIFPSGFVRDINVKVDTPTDAKLWLFTFDRDDLTNDSLRINLIKEFDITSKVVKINQQIDHKFILGIKCQGALYSMPVSTPSRIMGDVKVGQTYIFPLNQNEYSVSFAIKVNYVQRDTNNVSTNNISILNYNVPTKSDNIYPIVFDFTENKLYFNAIGLLSNKFDGTRSLAWGSLYTLDLPGLDRNRHDWQNYFLLTNDKKELKVIKCMGNIPFYGIIDEKAWSIIAGISVAVNEKDLRNKCYFYSNVNSDLIKVIFHWAESDASTEFPVIITKKMQNYGIIDYKYSAVGDSLTHGEDPNNHYKSAINHRYTDWVAKTLGLYTYNYGIGGTHINHTDDGKGMVDRVNNIENADIYSIFGGTNDCGASVPMGTINDGDMTHFAPAFNQILKTLVQKGGITFVITPPKAKRLMQKNRAGLTIEDYANKEKEIAAMWGIPVLDLNYEFQYTDAMGDQDFQKKWMPDGLHPCIDGYDQIGIRVSHFIKNLLNTLK